MKSTSLISAAVLCGILIVGCKPDPHEPRVRQAAREKDAFLARLFQERGATYPPRQLLLRAFKHEKLLEVWAESIEPAAKTRRDFVLIKKYPVCKASGRPGPKRREGDGQTPEGFYFIDRYNYNSKFFLSLGLNYPNASDRFFADPQRPGSDIFIHGSCWSAGCLAMTDDGIKEIFWLALQANRNGQARIPVQIFPFDFRRAAPADFIKTHGLATELLPFWLNLKEGFDFFERHRRPARVDVSEKGRFVFAADS